MRFCRTSAATTSRLHPVAIIAVPADDADCCGVAQQVTDLLERQRELLGQSGGGCRTGEGECVQQSPGVGVGQCERHGLPRLARRHRF